MFTKKLWLFVEYVLCLLDYLIPSNKFINLKKLLNLIIAVFFFILPTYI